MMVYITVEALKSNHNAENKHQILTRPYHWVPPSDREAWLHWEA